MKKPAFAALSALLVAACAATSGHQEIDATSTRLDELAASIEAVKGQIGATAGALATVVDKAKEDPVPSFDTFKQELENAQASHAQASARMASAKKESEVLFTSWTERAAAITDVELRKTSEERRDELRKAFDSVTASADASLAELGTFLATAKDVETYLTQDLTPKGIEAIADKSESLGKQAKSVAKSLDKTLEVTKKVAPQFATATPPPPPPAETKKE